MPWCLRGTKNSSEFNEFKIFFILCYTALKPFSTQNNQKTSHDMNAINNLSFSVHKITKNQTNIFSNIGWAILGRLSYYFLAEYHTPRIPPQKETAIGMFALYKCSLIRAYL